MDSMPNTYIKYAVDQSKHLNTMINNMLDYARLTHNKIEFARFDSEEVLKKTLINLKSSIEENDAVVTHGKLQKYLVMFGSCLILSRNLIGNAIKYRRQTKSHVSAVEKEDN